jgi:hypothetical protein
MEFSVFASFQKKTVEKWKSYENEWENNGNHVFPLFLKE